jgi:pilus assembly protein Flp/PilA
MSTDSPTLRVPINQPLKLSRQYGHVRGDEVLGGETAARGWRFVMLTRIKAFIENDSGATAIEYGLIASLIGVAIIAGVKSLGTKMSATFSKVSGNLA